jgi:methyl-accepting chemotaxis protein
MAITNSIRSTLIVSIVGLVLASQAVVGVLQYRELADAKREEIRNVVEAVVQPIVNLAASGVEGGNLMILQNSEAKSLYLASKVKYLRISGMSAGADKTDFSEAIPPQRIEHEFIDDKDARAAKYRNAAAASVTGLDRDNATFVHKQPLAGVKNGGEIIAVFSAESLSGLEWRVALNVLLSTTLISLVSVGLAILIGNRISDPIVAMNREISGINGAMDLSRRIDIRTDNEIGKAAQAFNGMMDSMQDTVSGMRGVVNAVTAVTGELAAGNQNLSQRTEEHATTLEETAASLEELTTTVRQNAENSRQANELAGGASRVAAKGGEVVGRMSGTMASIHESSKKVVSILDVIDGIAFQTNILALNAAVEAARAGEQGRGFAVVATEVRNLAQRSAAAAKDIKALIDESASKVEHGTRLAEDAARTMEEILQAVNRVTEITAEISVATVEQSTGIEQVNQSITQLDAATQQNAALVEEVSAAVETVEREVQRLAEAASVFKLGGASNPRSLASSADTGTAARLSGGPALLTAT